MILEAQSYGDGSIYSTEDGTDLNAETLTLSSSLLKMMYDIESFMKCV
jgi:hypothetical protein